ncbi:MAG: TIGR02206 family membrane protein [Acidimicrobiales bacterium]
MLGVVTPVPYLLAVVLALGTGVALCVGARRRPGPWTTVAARAIAVVLISDASSFIATEILARTWSPATDLPFALCDAAVLVAAAALWLRTPVLVELTYFWGLAGTLQAVITPDLNAGFPHLIFFQYLAGHLGIVLAAFYLVVGLRIAPRPGSVLKTFSITLAYSAFVGIVDAVSGANYMFLRRPPGNWTLLNLLGPWPWYIASAAVVAIVLFAALNLPFFLARRHG